ncbi:hypothetical protein AXG93_2035s1040 [Marchantia polymorpha subsp. ruderalis]|uniref:Uncharacterized protein n=1 Tax=Marchantia polymorpha subsp. ruderalis TaxID=1480154 RepID=A0A176VQQ3_MARPO|nr:hypothetical protein AXG93_2035s1040 [Marchantia polymorpha subsp. ruderalis]
MLGVDDVLTRAREEVAKPVQLTKVELREEPAKSMESRKILPLRVESSNDDRKAGAPPRRGSKLFRELGTWHNDNLGSVAKQTEPSAHEQKVAGSDICHPSTTASLDSIWHWHFDDREKAHNIGSIIQQQQHDGPASQRASGPAAVQPGLLLLLLLLQQVQTLSSSTME